MPSLFPLEPGAVPYVFSPVEFGPDPEVSCKAPVTFDLWHAFAVLGSGVGQAPKFRVAPTVDAWATARGFSLYASSIERGIQPLRGIHI